MTIRTIRTAIRKAKLSIMSIYLYGGGLMILFLLFIGAWLTNALFGLHADTQTLITFFNSYTSATVVGAIAFVSIFSINKNNDGDSDIAEKKSIEGNATLGTIKSIIGKGNT